MAPYYVFTTSMLWRRLLPLNIYNGPSWHYLKLWGAQWLSGRVLDSRPRGRGFEPHRCHCVVSLSKNISPSLVLVQPRKTRPFITERLLMGHKESNQTKSNQHYGKLHWSNTLTHSMLASHVTFGIKIHFPLFIMQFFLFSIHIW